MARIEIKYDDRELCGVHKSFKHLQQLAKDLHSSKRLSATMCAWQRGFPSGPNCRTPSIFPPIQTLKLGLLVATTFPEVWCFLVTSATLGRGILRT